MKINKFIIPEKFLSSMSEDEKMFAVLLGYFVNEMNLLYKCIRINADMCFKFMFIRLLASKLCEGWKMINNAYCNRELRLRLEKILSDKTKAIKKEINNFFGKNTYLMNIRKHLVFHYDQEIIKRALTGIKEYAMMYHTSEYAENCFYDFSELIIYEALKKEICPENCQEVCQETSPGICPKGKVPFLKKFMGDTGKICDWFSEFAMNCLDDIAEANNFDLKPEEILIPEPPTYKEIKFPFFIQRDEVK